MQGCRGKLAVPDTKGGKILLSRAGFCSCVIHKQHFHQINLKRKMDTSWFFDDLAIDDSIAIRLESQPTTVDAVKRMAGKSFQLKCDDNILDFKSLGEKV